jgi:transposase
MARTAVLTDEQWARIAPLMPCSEGLRGRPFRGHRQVVEGIVYRYRTGIPWRDLPECFGPWQTVWKRHNRFSLDGRWDDVLAVLIADADAQGELDWRISVDSSVMRVHHHGAMAKWAEQTPGSCSTSSWSPAPGKAVPALALTPCARTRPTPSRGTRALLRRRGIRAVIPEPRDQQAHRRRRGPRGGRPVSYDRDDYRNRNVVERCFDRLEGWRGLATRYDKHALPPRKAAE